MAKEASVYTKAEPPVTILYVFSGSDWCANCIELDKKIISDPAFQSSLKSHHIQLQIIDFPQRKKLKAEVVKYNSSVAEKFNFDGVYPTLIVFSAGSQKHKHIVYQNETAEAFLSRIIKEAATLHE
ncbi:MAG: thioredoxin fold domain-containing protein [Cyclobacteriaceae bacterium]